MIAFVERNQVSRMELSKAVWRETGVSKALIGLVSKPHLLVIFSVRGVHDACIAF